MMMTMMMMLMLIMMMMMMAMMWNGGFCGLKFYQKAADWGHWSTWPSIDIAQDLGGDGNAPVHAFQYKYKLNMLQQPDGSHGANRDFDLMLVHSHLKEF
eukprot:4911283-Karenia_brevis.AAC.1